MFASGLALTAMACWLAWPRAQVLAAAPALALTAPPPTPHVGIVATAFDEVVPAPPPPVALSLRLIDGEFGVRVFAGDGRFPVVSADGNEIAELFQDGEDFSGAPISTLVVWSRTGKRTASFTLGGAANSVTEVRGETAARLRHEDKMLAAANARLARARWRSLAHPLEVAQSDDGETTTVTTSAGDLLVFTAHTERLSRQRAGTTRRRALAQAFPAPGGRWEGGGCGEIRGIERAFGDDHLVILVPSVQLGGDSCFGSPSAELALAVRL